MYPESTKAGPRSAPAVRVQVDTTGDGVEDTAVLLAGGGSAVKVARSRRVGSRQDPRDPLAVDLSGDGVPGPLLVLTKHS